jgi:hypothetical protein
LYLAKSAGLRENQFEKFRKMTVSDSLGISGFKGTKETPLKSIETRSSGLIGISDQVDPKFLGFFLREKVKEKKKKSKCWCREPFRLRKRVLKGIILK